jgi:hypothetical protein
MYTAHLKEYTRELILADGTRVTSGGNHLIIDGPPLRLPNPVFGFHKITLRNIGPSEIKKLEPLLHATGSVEIYATEDVSGYSVLKYEDTHTYTFYDWRNSENYVEYSMRGLTIATTEFGIPSLPWGKAGRVHHIFRGLINVSALELRTFMDFMKDVRTVYRFYFMSPIFEYIEWDSRDKFGHRGTVGRASPPGQFCAKLRPVQDLRELGPEASMIMDVVENKVDAWDRLIQTVSHTMVYQNNPTRLPDDGHGVIGERGSFAPRVPRTLSPWAFLLTREIHEVLLALAAVHAIPRLSESTFRTFPRDLLRRLGDHL